MEKTKKNDSRYPYTYACDFIRSIAGYNQDGTKLSRSDASAIRSTIAEIAGINDTHLAILLADKELSKTEEEHKSSAIEAANSIFGK
ncbi:MAG: hypothetical protein KKD44_26365 [Proteobacteria bacterium]|nr:hypothetical protein [Pseudomonadota bacterium]